MKGFLSRPRSTSWRSAMGALTAVASALGIAVAVGLVLGVDAAAAAGAEADAAPSPTSAAELAAPTAEQELAAQLVRQPLGAEVVGSTIEYAGGAVVFVAVDDDALGTASCTADHLCIWESAYYLGSFWAVSAEGSTVALPSYIDRIGSLWNRRDGRTLMFPSVYQGWPSYCYAPGTMLSTVTGTRSALRAAFLSTSSGC